MACMAVAVVSALALGKTAFFTAERIDSDISGPSRLVPTRAQIIGERFTSIAAIRGLPARFIPQK
jgi:hypothetical protein